MQNLRVFWSFILFHAVLLSSINSCSPSIFTLKNETDRLALLGFKYGISEDPYRVLSSWNDSLHFCQWMGVTCSRRHHQRVTSLNLTEHSLLGHLSPHIGNLSFLRRIDLSNNKFQGQIPQEIEHLFRLQHLNLSVNSLQGEIPSNLSHCSKLIIIHIMQNQLVGELPADLGSLSMLIVLSVSKNDLRGSIPPSLGNLSSLTTLDLTYNNFEGQIPNQLGQLAGIINFAISANQLSGTIPPSIYNLSSIQVFSVSVNRLHGSIPPNLGLAFPHLRWISLGGNQFTGPIPISLSNASSLENFNIFNNSFSGPVPANIGSLSSLYRFTIGMNQLGSREGDDLSFLTSLTNCTNLEVIAASINNLSGQLPGSIANLSTQLNILFLRDNKIFGVIPKGIENLVSLYALSLRENSLKGTLPDAIGKLKKLQALALSRNKFSGQIPPSIGNITRLSILFLDENDFHGSIPSSFGNWGFLEQLFISQNKFNGTILKQVGAVKINMSRNSFTGSLLLEVHNLENIREMDVSENKLSGEIPDTLGMCQSMELLYMHGNLFQGTIPESLKNLKGIKELDLSRNNLSGQIPKYFEEFHFLQYLNLSFNNFEGEVPKGRIFKNASAISVVGNSKLCGGIPELQLPGCPKQASKKQGKPLAPRLKVTVITVVLSLFLLSCIIAALYWRRNSPKKASSPSSTENQWLQVSYADLLQATNGFSSANLIGVGSFGSVYKGLLECFETLVAVKVLNLLQQGSFKSFAAECEALRNIRHRNLVKILTVCSSIDFNGNDFKALVFEYMSNGSLEKWLHPNVDEQPQLRNLNLTQRLNIAIDVALALDYLHHHCQTPIVHRDLKPSNVLLDDDMVAHVGDFGLARFLSEAAESCSQNQTGTSGIKGSIGYIPPEHGMGGKVSTHGDVYSYGILLLEMITGKRPTDDMFKDNQSLHHFAKSAFPEQVMEIIDPRLLSEDSEAIQDSKNHNNLRNRMHDCLVSLVSVGVSCSAESPKERMKMRDVVMEMHAIRDLHLEVGIH
ncbi:probable LRR receptor-like serine/threonine-protein kinase At3g47570 isoform X2 [Magnolia sinica]|uniref:probable LRR receptor-like serine/threonine-protein kinase At3g47570 isoform X2 n=1 Tax=Magnolia sinica TaxID=86752 RepID=UPI002658E43C|nr:probable LRR receptor-like serine/threonine-protein kinase At3g47570 isoform X2 [Magnolia sinica]